MYKGLTSQQVKQRIDEGLVNTYTETSTRSYSQIIYSNVFTYFNAINFVLFCFVLLTGHLKNGLFMGTIICNACIGTFQQIRSKRLLDKLSFLVKDAVEVIRDHTSKKIQSDEIVKDDLVHLYHGQQIPIDGEVVGGFAEVDESALTGESKHIEKRCSQKVYAGTIVVSGDMYVRVNQVGKECAIHQIIKESKKEAYAQSVLHHDLEKIIRVISIIIIPTGICLYFTQNVWIGLPWRDALLKTIAAVVGMIPEGLIVLTSISLTVSSIRLAKSKVLIQDLFSIESLARIDVACFDKTGILTTGNMKVEQVKVIHQKYAPIFSEMMGSYLKAQTHPNATSNALLSYFQTNDVYPILETLPFSSQRKYAACQLEGIGTIYVGAYSYLFPKQDASIVQMIHPYTSSGKRVIVVAISHQKIEQDCLPSDLTFVAFISLQDELRSNAKQIISYFKKQDVRVCVISGDDANTVSSLAKFAGINNADRCMDMHTFEGEIEDSVEDIGVFGRVKPQQKKEIVKALIKKGHHVLMVGDGVNDVPALKCSDVSVSIGEATQAAKNTANIVLLNNDFEQLPKIIGEGRRVINNISLASSMYLVKTLFSIFLSIYVVLTHHPYPFLPIHLTVISAIGVGIPTFIFQSEPSFERIQGNFIHQALIRALPSSMTVLLAAWILFSCKSYFHMDDSSFYGVFVCITGYIYLWTLYFVYQPLTKLRALIIGCMAIVLASVVTVFAPFIQVTYTRSDIWNIVIGIFVVPIVLYGMRYIQGVIIHGRNRKNETESL